MFFQFLSQYSKFHQGDLVIISQFQYKKEVTKYEIFFDQGVHENKSSCLDSLWLSLWFSDSLDQEKKNYL